MFVKWQNHVYDFEIMISNHVSDSGKSNAPRVVAMHTCHTQPLWRLDIYVRTKLLHGPLFVVVFEVLMAHAMEES